MGEGVVVVFLAELLVAQLSLGFWCVHQLCECAIIIGLLYN